MQTKEKRQEYYQRNKEKIKNKYRTISPEAKENNRKKSYAYYIKNRDIILIRRKKYASYGKNRSGKNRTRSIKDNLTSKERSIKYKTLILEHYGKECECCKENNFYLLSVDHINNNGREHKNINGRKLKGVNLYRFLVKENYPTGLRILCFNCNIGRQSNKGICPHKGK